VLGTIECLGGRHEEAAALRQSWGSGVGRYMLPWRQRTGRGVWG
jgi:hypothetical protein